jgi:hypothetical protein
MGRDVLRGSCGKKVLNCQIFIVGCLHNAERKRLQHRVQLRMEVNSVNETTQVAVCEWYCNTPNEWFFEAM